MSEAVESKSTSRILRWGIWTAPILLLLTLFGWALSSPAGSSPDDDFHVASIWCAYGEREGLCETSDRAETERMVPASIVQMTCFAFNADVSGACQQGITEHPSSDLLPVNHGNWNGATYPPLFYGAFGLFASENVAISIVAIRLVNALLATTILTVAMIALPRRLRPVLAISSVIAFVPLGLSVLASTNPSSWALLSGAIVFPTVLAIAETTGRQRNTLITLAIVGAVLGAGARADSAAYAAFAALLALFLSAKWNRLTIIVGATIVAISALFYLSAGQSNALNGLKTVGAEEAEGTVGSLRLLVVNLTQLPELWLGMFTNLGWLDTRISPLAVFAMVFAAISVIFTALAGRHLRKAIALGAATAAITVLPLYILFTSNAAVGTQVQPRYVLPLFVILLAVALTPAPDSPRFTPTQVWVLTVMVICAQTLALYDQMTRYIAGQRIINLDAGSWWWGGAPTSPMLTLGITAASFGLLIIFLAISYTRGTGITETRPASLQSSN